MDVTLIIPAHNEEHFIGDCIDSVHAHARGKFKEIVVVDNASTDNTAAVARAKGARVIVEPLKGLTRARQTGLISTTGEYVAFIDADCHIHDGWFSILEQHRARYPEAVVFSGPIKYYDGPYLLRAFVVFVQYLLLPTTLLIAGQWVLGGNFIARRDALLEAGGFDPSISFYGEDADIGRRLAKVGRCVFKPDLYVYTSARRILHEGIFHTYARYTLNFIWHILFHRSFTTAYRDVRHDHRTGVQSFARDLSKKVTEE